MWAEFREFTRLLVPVTHWLKYRIGRRGVVLGALGLIWGLYGFAQYAAPPPQASQNGLYLLTLILPYQYWALLWVTAAFISFSATFRTRGDTYGFVALLIPPLLWTSVYFVSWWPLAVFERGWVAALVWAAMAAVILVTAGWPEQK